jgi:hypothetical protein
MTVNKNIWDVDREQYHQLKEQATTPTLEGMES